jgi:hypothetical protein
VYICHLPRVLYVLLVTPFMIWWRNAGRIVQVMKVLVTLLSSYCRYFLAHWPICGLSVCCWIKIIKENFWCAFKETSPVYPFIRSWTVCNSCVNKAVKVQWKLETETSELSRVLSYHRATNWTGWTFFKRKDIILWIFCFCCRKY